MSGKLFEPLKMGDFILPNRVIMAPLTRCRAIERRIPNALMAEQYRQRASAGLILSEATAVDPMGVGYPDTPGLWNEEQTEGWKLVTEAVHAAGGRIFAQLWHVGRVSDPFYLDGKTPVAPSAIALEGHVSTVRPKRPYQTPRALDIEEIPGVVEAYRKGAENALKAGFDGIELHGANGYLIDQFLQASSNVRTDAYGGPIENRTRFLEEVLDSVLTVWAPERVGLHLAPRGDEDPDDPTGEKLFTRVGRESEKRKLAFICSREAKVDDNWLGLKIRKAYSGVYIANEAFTRESAEMLLQAGQSDAVAWGRLFIANPDLPRRFLESAPLNEPDPGTFGANGEGSSKGYTDYPALT